MVAPVAVAAVALPAIVAVAIRYLVGYLITRVITTLGIALVSFTALNYTVDYIVDYVNDSMSGVSGDVLYFCNLLGFFDVVSILISAWVAAINIRMLRGVYNRITFGNVLGG